MNSHRKDSVLYDPDISLTEEQLSQEIDILTAELEKYRHVNDDRSLSHGDTPRTVFRHSDSGIGSVRRSEQLSKQTNSPIYETNVSSSVIGGGFLGARPRSSVRFETSTPAAEKQTSKHFSDQLQLPINDKFVTKRSSKTGLTRDTRSYEEKQSYPLDGYKNKNIVKTATYDGKGPWLDFRSHFDACSQINNWTDKEKALEERFSPSNQTELYRTQLRERHQRAVETLPELGQDIRRLTNLAYATAPNEVRDTLAKEQFIDSLIDSDMRLRIKQARPTDLNDAIRHAVELEAFNKAEIKRIEGQGFLRTASENTHSADSITSLLLKTISETLIELQKEIRDLKQNNKGWKQGGAPQPFPFKCYACDEVGHRAFECPTYPNYEYDYQRPRYQNKSKTRYTNQNYEKSDSTPRKVGVHKLSPDAGMFLKAKVNGIITDLLIDTGATVTVISTKMFTKMSNMPNLIPTERDILTANGDSLLLSGKTVLEIETDTFKCINTAIVADINVDCILGLDFLRTQEANINISKGTLTIRGHEVRFYVQGHIGCDRVAVSETVNIPSRSEIVVNGAISDDVPDSFEVGLVEPTDDYKRIDKATVGRALCAKSKNHLLLCAKEKSEIRCEDCGTVFKRQEYLKRHMKNIHGVETAKKSYKIVEKKVGVSERGQDDLDQYDPWNLVEDISDDSSNADLDTPDESKSFGQDSELKACYSEEGTDGSVKDKEEEKEAVFHDKVYSEEDTSQKKEDKKVDHTPEDKKSDHTVRKKCATLPVLAPTKRKSQSFIRGDSVEKEACGEIEHPKTPKFVTKEQATQTNLAKERKMVKIITKYVENGHQIKKVEEHEKVWMV
ncbi:unnamed protein product [Mytilus coruscus]|uniref:CCHC-type domain-containing protein n=1 Tax=Mytilus coruscus TaxID=42192 RepID=A0A6J8DZV8_MYTCO|nr:unnamed protein product [Mytilus coruscus]